jgi:cytochrome c-type biogenesis protein CcmE
MTKGTTLAIVGLVVAVAGLVITLVLAALPASADYGALEQRVTGLEERRAEESTMLRETRDTVIRLCALSPGCRE